MSIEVLKAGLLTTVQDLGRHGYQKQGVVVGGAMDAFALRMANLLVGNEERAAGLEMTLLGSKLRLGQDLLIAVCGGDFVPRVNGVELPQWQPVWARAGSVLEMKSVQAGCRAYLAVAGGIAVPEVLGSRSTYLRAGIGGLAGRALREGDVLEAGAVNGWQVKRMAQMRAEAGRADFVEAETFPAWELFPAYDDNPVVRVLRGREYDWFDEGSRARFFEAEYTVTPQSDRMGYRLQGEALQLSTPQEMISEAVTSGTVQVPVDGQPIVLLADRQTTGGYPRIAQVITVDVPVLAQVKPGGKVRFREVTLAEAQAELLLRERDLALFRIGMKLEKR